MGGGEMPELDPMEQREFNLIHRILGAEPGEQVPIQELQDKLRQWNKGLSVQDEFALLVGWSGRAAIIHTFDETVYAKAEGEEIPDFFCLLVIDGKEVPVLVEVKSTTKSFSKFTKKYLDGLEKYAARLGIPVILAHKHSKYGRPLWNLVEIKHIRTPSGAGKAEPMEMMKNQLLTLLLGHFHVTIWQGTSFVLRVTKEEIFDQREDSYFFKGRVKEVYWETKDGKRVDDAPLSFSGCS